MAEMLQNLFDSLELSIGLVAAIRAMLILNVPRILSSAGPCAALSAEDICHSLPDAEQASSENLEKILDVLSSYGILTTLLKKLENQTVKTYQLTTNSRRFLTDRATEGALFLTSPAMMQVWPHLHEMVLSPQTPPFERVHGKGYFHYLTEDAPTLHQLSVKMMASRNADQMDVLLKHYDEELRTLKGRFVDVGGNEGAFIAAVAARHSHLRCINFDLPEVIENAPVIPGVEHLGGDFLDKIPEGELMILKFVLLNWNDQQCCKILKNAYNGLTDRGKILVVDKLSPSLRLDYGSDPIKNFGAAWSNMCTSMLFKGAKIRSQDEMRRLIESAGFTKVEVVKLPGKLENGNSLEIDLVEAWKLTCSRS
ncbi:hypothetical protein Mapa_004988 [Marchantia paleacea]|nr:hypothetical protein Mapa_004988 [Marchantia paleacea]